MDIPVAAQGHGMQSGAASSRAGEDEALSNAPREAAVDWQSESVRSIELPAAQAHAPLAVSAERGVACAFVGVQRAVVLDLVGLQDFKGMPTSLHDDAHGF